jgi:acetolactate decarboxylase
MNKSTPIIATAIFIVLTISCQNGDNKDTITEVKYSGALRTLMSGNIQPVISLDSLSNNEHLYALGAVENLKGEIQIFDSKPSNSFVIDNILQIKNSYNLKASLLVYAEVEEWTTSEVSNITTKSDLEEQIFETAKSNGINIEKPFPFLLEGTIASLDWHVINWKDNDTIHSHKKHTESGLNGTLNNKHVEILGFYSTKHKTVFTHHTTNMHMHFKTNENSLAGHIDDLKLSETLTLKLPKQ